MGDGVTALGRRARHGGPADRLFRGEPAHGRDRWRRRRAQPDRRVGAPIIDPNQSTLVSLTSAHLAEPSPARLDAVNLLLSVLPAPPCLPCPPPNTPLDSATWLPAYPTRIPPCCVLHAVGPSANSAPIRLTQLDAEVLHVEMGEREGREGGPERLAFLFARVCGSSQSVPWMMTAARFELSIFFVRCGVI